MRQGDLKSCPENKHIVALVERHARFTALIKVSAAGSLARPQRLRSSPLCDIDQLLESELHGALS